MEQQSLLWGPQAGLFVAKVRQYGVLLEAAGFAWRLLETFAGAFIAGGFDISYENF